MRIGGRMRDLFETVLFYLLLPVFLVLALIVGEDEDPFDEEDPLAMAYEYEQSA